MDITIKKGKEIIFSRKDNVDIWHLEDFDEKCSCPPKCRHLEIDDEEREFCSCNWSGHLNYLRTPILYRKGDKVGIYYGMKQTDDSITLVGSVVEKNDDGTTG